MMKSFMDSYENPRELAEYLKSAPCVNNWARQYDKSVTQVDYNNLVNGENVVIKDFASKIEALENVQSKFTNVYNVCGSRIDMSRAMTGNPKSMVVTQHRQKKTRDITFVVDMTMPAGVPNGTIREIGSRVLSALERMQLEGNKIALYAVCSGSESKRSSINAMLVKLKEFGEATELSRLSFALSNPNFLRHVFFEWHKTDKNITMMSGLGHAISFDYTPEELSKAFSYELERKVIYLSFLKYRSLDIWESDKIYEDLLQEFDTLDKTVFLNN